MLRRTFPLGVFSFAVVVASGCGGSSDRPELGEVAGTVTDGGAPVVDASVEFRPEEGGRPSVGTTDAEGRYSLRYTVDAEGAQVGPHTVRITPYNAPLPPPGSDMSKPMPPAIPPVTVPEPVMVESGDNTFNFDLDELGS